MSFRLIYDVRFILLDLVHAIFRGLGLIGIIALLYGIPGWSLLVLLVGKNQAWGWEDWAGLSVGVSLAIYPVLFLWADMLGLRPGPLWVGIPITLGLAGITYRLRIEASAMQKWRFHDLWIKQKLALRKPNASGVSLMLVLGLSMATRLLAVRGLEAPLWGDGFQHTMIVQLMLDHGGLFRSWEPYAPIQSFTYHFGFHSAVALLAWATGWPAERAVLFGGQVLNALAALAIYPLARQLASGSSWAGVIAVMLPSLLWPMPMYYVNWGRYPQLAGHTLLPVAVILSWQLLESPQRTWRRIGLVALMIAGLALTHYRVLAFYGLSIVAWWVLRGWRVHSFGDWLRRLVWGSLAPIGLSIVFTLPWWFRIGDGRLPTALAHAMSSGAGGWIPLSWNELVSYVPAWGWILGGLSLGIGLHRYSQAVTLLVLWWCGIFLSANLQLLRMPGASVISGFAFWIAVYMPVAVLIGISIGKMLERWMRGPWQWAGVLVIVILGLFGARDRLSDVDPSRHALLTRPDRIAMDWIQKNTPTDARFLINGFLAYDGQDAVGSDGGWWLPLLARRAGLIPPLPYAVEQTKDPDLPVRLRAWISGLASRDSRMMEELIRMGWCYIYIGQRRGMVNAPSSPLWIPEELAVDGSPWEPIYARDLVRVFRWSDCSKGDPSGVQRDQP
ncbi:MAG: hypothetical protein RMK32_02925 [Anaerolineae bacterium]|nr:hypothetical protein [Thermoflexus sp.]MDW8064570.1 hypothetical protein [Anaerolineae bacterium]